MEIKNIQETENALFKRKEIVAEVESEAVPSNEEVKNALAEKFSVSEDAIKIKKIASKFGSKIFLVDANIYASKEDLNSVEVKTKKEREAEKKAEEERLKAGREAKKKAEEEVQKAEAEKPVEKNKPEESKE